MNIEDHKQLDQLVLDEVNVKEFTRVIGNTEKGQLELMYDGEYYWVLGDVKLDKKSHKRIYSDNFMAKVIENISR